jgi:hypothetical protein
MFFSRFEYHVFYVLLPFVAYLGTLPRIWGMRLEFPDLYIIPTTGFWFSRLFY